ncbi:hypothetical protein DSECCO2_170710 [anaerobic digester metagenome]
MPIFLKFSASELDCLKIRFFFFEALLCISFLEKNERNMKNEKEVQEKTSQQFTKWDEKCPEKRKFF